MPLPPQAIREFVQIWHEEYGEGLTFEQAPPIAERFLSAFRFLYLTNHVALPETPTPDRDRTVSG